MNLNTILNTLSSHDRRFDGFSKFTPTRSPLTDRRMAAIARAAAIEVLG